MSDPHQEYYLLLRTTLEEPPSKEVLALLKKQASAPPPFPKGPFIEKGWQRLNRFFEQYQEDDGCAAAAKSHHTLLGNPLGPKLEPYASHYSGGTRQGKPLIAIRQFLKEWKLIGKKELFKDYEDHAIFLLDCTLQLMNLREAEGEPWEKALEQLITHHLLPWFPAFLEDLGKADEQEPSAGFYAGVALLGQGIMALEEEILTE